MGIPGCPVVKTPPSEAGGCWFTGSIPGQGAKIPHASWPKKAKHKKINNIVTNSIKISKIVHVKKKKIFKRPTEYLECEGKRDLCILCP